MSSFFVFLQVSVTVWLFLQEPEAIECTGLLVPVLSGTCRFLRMFVILWCLRAETQKLTQVI